MKNIVLIIRSLKLHPLNKGLYGIVLAFAKLLIWQILSSLKPSKKFVYGFTSLTNFYAKKGMTGITGNIYCGLHEFEDMSFLLHFLRSDDTFYDIGSNVGSYTILASAHVGAKTIACEPITQTFSHLLDNLKLNKIEHLVIAKNVAIGSEPGTLNMANNKDTMNYISDTSSLTSPSTESVKIETLQNIGSKPDLIKIDVEGYEYQVLKGGDSLLSNSEPVLILEVTKAYKTYGTTLNQIDSTLKKFGYDYYEYSPFNRKLKKLTKLADGNNICIKPDSLARVENRLANASGFKIRRHKI
ncbi:MAG: FkbM family methyltransferase [Bacteroidia bacterium]|jgi:FkbM family methyltransferase